MLFDAIILTGGRSSRLDSVPKSEFIVEDSTLLDRTLHAAAHARRIVVVGHEPATALPAGVLLVREEPPFSGPVAAIAAGMTALGSATDAVSGDGRGEASDARDAPDARRALLILACDMPHIGRAVSLLLSAIDAAPEADGVIAIDAENRRQPLAAVYRTGALVRALDAVASTAQSGDPLAGLPMFRLLDHLTLRELRVPSGATSDVDTWDDAVRLGAQPPTISTTT